MDVYLENVRRLLPILGTDLLTPLKKGATTPHDANQLFCEIKGMKAIGLRTPNGFVVLRGSAAVQAERPSAATRHPGYLALRKALIEEGALLPSGDHFAFSRDVEFASPSAAAAVVHGGGANGLLAWRDAGGRTLKEIEAEA